MMFIFRLMMYTLFIFIAYMYNANIFVKMIPAVFSVGFFLTFFLAYLRKKHLVLFFTQKFYKKSLSERKKRFLESSDGYWALVLFFNIVMQISFAFFASSEVWAVYSSVGWYVYLLLALAIQIVYEWIFITRMLK